MQCQYNNEKRVLLKRHYFELPMEAKRRVDFRLFASEAIFVLLGAMMLVPTSAPRKTLLRDG